MSLAPDDVTAVLDAHQADRMQRIRERVLDACDRKYLALFSSVGRHEVDSASEWLDLWRAYEAREDGGCL